jgi:transcriptional regulator with XRE-family HTH domain
MFNLPDIVTEQEENDFFENISRNIKRVRKEKNMSQLEVALSIGQKSSGFYACIENHSHNKHFNLKHLLRLAKLFEVPVEEFFKADKASSTKPS